MPGCGAVGSPGQGRGVVHGRGCERPVVYLREWDSWVPVSLTQGWGAQVPHGWPCCPQGLT